MKSSSEIWLICGSRSKKNYSDIVSKELNNILNSYRHFLGIKWKPKLIIEGECPDSADVYSRIWAEQNKIPVKPFPSENGKYLKRNIKMVNLTHEIFAFWNGYSYGTAQTIAQGIMQGKEVTVIDLNSCYKCHL